MLIAATRLIACDRVFIPRFRQHMRLLFTHPIVHIFHFFDLSCIWIDQHLLETVPIATSGITIRFSVYDREL